jgi:hypothetical protein
MAGTKSTREVTKMLKASGLPWDMAMAKDHMEVFIRGERVLVFSPNASKAGSFEHLRSAIRRHQEAAAASV